MAKKGVDRVYINPSLGLFPVIPKKTTPDEARAINEQRGYTAKLNTGEFYVHLYHALMGGRILFRNEHHINLYPLFEDSQEDINSNFQPDIIYGDGQRQIEVKATSVHGGTYLYKKGQFANYCLGFLEHPESLMYTGIFKYGDSRVKGKIGGKEVKYERLAVCRQTKKNLCKDWGYCKSSKGLHLVERLSHATRDLTIIPHNLMTFILSVSASSSLGTGSEKSHRIHDTNYFMPYGGGLTILKQNYTGPVKAAELIKENRKKWFDRKWSRILGESDVLDSELLGNLKIEDFLLDDLHAEQFQSPDRIYITMNVNPPRTFKIYPFTVTRFFWRDLSDACRWRDKFAGSLDMFLEQLGIRELFHEQKQKNEVPF